MNTKNAIIQNLYTSTEMADCIRKMTPEPSQQDELRQNLFEALLSYDEEKILALHGSGVLKYYAIRILLNLNSRANPVNKKNRIGGHDDIDFISTLSGDNSSLGQHMTFKKHGSTPRKTTNIHSQYFTDEEQKILNQIHQRQAVAFDDIGIELEFMKNENGRGFLCSVVFQEYVNLGSVRKVAAAIGIPAKSVWNAVNEVRNRLKNKFHVHSDLV